MSEERFSRLEARLDRLEGIFRSIADSFDPPTKQAPPQEQPPAEQPSFTEKDLEAIQWFRGADGEWVFRQNTRGETDPLIVKMRDLLDSEIARGAKGPVKVGKWLIGYNDPNHVFIGRRLA